ncbi:hypothetical protein TNCV_3082691 [Trichonephila clavipes]|nr:hypothetical protein TNCV_3082691 [Trichonephila clavipes]
MKRKDLLTYYALTTLNKLVFNTKHLEIVASAIPTIFVFTKETSAKRNLDRYLQEYASNPSAQNIFQQISNETGAAITWEAGCKTVPLRREYCIHYEIEFRRDVCLKVQVSSSVISGLISTSLYNRDDGHGLVVCMS